MNPSLLHHISQIVVVVGLIMAAVGSYGAFHYGKKVEEQRQETRIIASHKRLNETIDWYIEFWGRLGNNSQKNIKVNIFEYFNKTYFETLSTFNVYSRPNYPDYKTWYEVINNHKNRFHISMKDILNTYINFLDDETINLIEKNISTSKFFPPNTLFESAPFPLPFNRGLKADFENHIKIVLELLKKTNPDLVSKKFEIGR